MVYTTRHLGALWCYSHPDGCGGKPSACIVYVHFRITTCHACGAIHTPVGVVAYLRYAVRTILTTCMACGATHTLWV